MKHLTDEEELVLKLIQRNPIDFDLNDQQVLIADGLEKRKMLRKWEEVDNEGNVWDYWDVNLVGIMVLNTNY